MPETIQIQPDKLVAHPDNDPARSDIQNCLDILESIEEHGQREPGKVRKFGKVGGRYEILSGHRRATCCRYLGKPFEAIVVDNDDDREAARDLILGNIRRDLDPIARAALIRTAIDSGIATDEAARMFGLEPHTLQQAARLLDLPESLQKLIATGILSQREARHFLPFAEAKIAGDRIAAEIQKNEHLRIGWKPHTVADAYKRLTRPCDTKTRYELYHAQSHPRRFESDPATDEKLQIVTLPVGVGRRRIPVAQNTVLWDRLQKKALADRNNDEATPAANASDKPDAELTQAQQQQRDTESDRALEIYIGRWWATLRRACIAKAIVDTDNLIIHEVAPLLLAHLGRDAGRWLAVTFQTLDVDAETDEAKPQLQRDAIVATAYGCDYLKQLFAIVAYPSSLTGIDQARPILDDALPTTLPLSEPELDPFWAYILERLRLDDETCWELAAETDHIARQLARQLLGRHTRRQLHRLAIQFGLDIAGPITAENLLDLHTTESPLPMPPRQS